MTVRIFGREIEAVTFDFWWTLFRDKNGLADTSVADLRIELISRFCRQKGECRSINEIKAALEGGREFFEVRHKKRLFTSTEDVVARILSILGVDFQQHEIRLLANQISHLGSLSELEMLEGARAVIEKLKLSGVRIAIISDTVLTKGRHLLFHLRRAGILKYFDVLSFSDEVRAVKPNREIFEATLKRLQTEPENALHIGDFPWSDIEGAKNMGMLAFQYIGGMGPEKNNIHPKADLVLENFLDMCKMF